MMRKKIMVILIVFMAFWMPVTGVLWAQEPDLPQSPGRIDSAIDSLVVRPLSVVFASVTTSLFMLTLPATYALDQEYGSLEYLVEKPWQYVNDRPSGVLRPSSRMVERVDRELNAQFGGLLERAGLNGKVSEIE